MRFLIQRETLLAPLQHLIGVVERRQVMPILANILLQVKTDSISLTASNLEVEFSETIMLDSVVEEGSITVPAHKLLDITRVLPSNSVLECELDNQKLRIVCERSQFVLMTLPAKEFPHIQYDKNNVEFALQQKELRDLIERVYFSMAQQDVRYYLNGLLFEITNQHVRSVATDGHRLAMCTILKTQEISNRQYIIPRKAVLELLKLIADTEDPVTISFGDSHIKICTQNLIFVSKLIDAKFPNYETVLPRGGKKQILLNSEIFKKILSRIAILSNEKFHGVRFALRTGKLIISSRNNEQEEAKEEMDVDYNNEPLEIGFNVNYFLDLLTNSTTSDIDISFSDDNSSALVQIKGKEEALYVIMPMRL